MTQTLPSAEGADPGTQEQALVRPLDLARRPHALERLLVERDRHRRAFDVRPSARTPTRPCRLVDRPPELPDDGGNRIRPQVATAVLGEAVDRLDEPDRAGPARGRPPDRGCGRSGGRSHGRAAGSARSRDLGPSDLRDGGTRPTGARWIPLWQSPTSCTRLPPRRSPSSRSRRIQAFVKTHA